MSRMAFALDIEKETLKNNNYREVISTDKYQQLVLMCLNPGEYIHREKHNGTQFFRIEGGNGAAEIGSKREIVRLKDGVALTVKPNILHKIVNTSKTKKLKLYSIYSPPQHKHGRIDKRQPDDDDHH